MSDTNCILKIFLSLAAYFIRQNYGKSTARKIAYLWSCLFLFHFIYGTLTSTHFPHAYIGVPCPVVTECDQSLWQHSVFFYEPVSL